LWAQREDRVLLTVAIPDCKGEKIDITASGLEFSGKGGNGTDYEFKLEFNGEIDPEASKWKAGARSVFFDLGKKEDGFWDRVRHTIMKQFVVMCCM